jgi:hypothetical protein
LLLNLAANKPRRARLHPRASGDIGNDACFDRRGDVMRRVLPILLLPSLLVGCDSAPPAPAAATGAGAQLRVGFLPHGLVDTIEVDAVDRLPLQAAALVAPDGAATPAGYVNAETSHNLSTGQWDASHQWQDAVTGNNAYVTLSMPHIDAGAALRSQGQLMAVVSTADITLPDPVVYRRDWQHYRVRLTFGTSPGAVETREIAAPEPLPTE